MFKFNAEINGREIWSKVREIVDEETDYDETIRREPSAFMMAEKLKNIFMVSLNVEAISIIRDSFPFFILNRSNLENWQPNRAPLSVSST